MIVLFSCIFHLIFRRSTGKEREPRKTFDEDKKTDETAFDIRTDLVQATDLLVCNKTYAFWNAFLSSKYVLIEKMDSQYQNVWLLYTSIIHKYNYPLIANLLIANKLKLGIHQTFKKWISVISFIKFSTYFNIILKRLNLTFT